MLQQYGIFELRVPVAKTENPFLDVRVECTFESKEERITVKGFCDGERSFLVRFMPSFAGEYRYHVTGIGVESVSGSFQVQGAAGTNHGPVRTTARGFFAYADGTPYYPVGTTCYAWIHQPVEMREKTMESLEQSPFNKLRMCIFPKHYVFNQTDHGSYPFPKTGEGDGDFDFSRFDLSFFRKLDDYLLRLRELGIEADLILFHPYDKWGFAGLDREICDRYLDYMMARYGAYRNVWWSLANEYDFMEAKKLEDWEHYGQYLMEGDPYHHLRGIHNAVTVYDPGATWLTHVSIQNQEFRNYAGMGREYREKYGKPVIFDEVGYEGNINAIWGSLSAGTLLWRSYMAVLGGCYVTHGETFYSKREDLWWSHGGELRGEAVPRLAFLRKILEETPGNGLRSVDMVWDDMAVCADEEGDYMLFYYGMYCPAIREFYKLDEDGDYRVELIDTWNMTVEDQGVFHGHFELPMPGREHMLVRVRKCV